MVLLLIFFGVLVLRALMDASELLFKQYKASQEVFQETLGEEKFARKLGQRVKAVWKAEEEWDYAMDNIRYFKPIDEPDVPLDMIGKLPVEGLGG